MKTCSLIGCTNKYYAKGFCEYHYNRSTDVRTRNRIRCESEIGKQKQHTKNLKYGASFKGSMTRRFKSKNLSSYERKKAEEAFRVFDGKCGCCGTINPGIKGWVLDHKGDKFRGILCMWCNCAAGFLKDDTERCKNLIKYIEKYENRKISPSEAAFLGAGALKHINHYVREAVKTVQVGKLAGYTVGIMNALWLNCSELGHEIALHNDISLTWYENDKGVIIFSLRSEGDKDVSAVAKRFPGGGGHKNAAGFELPVYEGRELIDHILNRSVNDRKRIPGGCL